MTDHDGPNRSNITLPTQPATPSKLDSQRRVRLDQRIELPMRPERNRESQDARTVGEDTTPAVEPRMPNKHDRLELWVPDPEVLDEWHSDSFGIDEAHERSRMRADALKRPALLRHIKEATGGPVYLDGERDAERFVAHRPPAQERLRSRREPGMTRMSWMLLDVLAAFGSITVTGLHEATGSSESSIHNKLAMLDTMGLITKVSRALGSKTVYGISKDGRSLIGLARTGHPSASCERAALITEALLRHLVHWDTSEVLTRWDLMDEVPSTYKSAEALQDTFGFDTACGTLLPDAVSLQDFDDKGARGDIYLYVDSPRPEHLVFLDAVHPRHAVLHAHLIVADPSLADLHWWPGANRQDRRLIVHLAETQ